MPHGLSVARSDNCTSDCRNGQIWNPGTGPSPCPICRPGAGIPNRNGGAR